MRSGAQVSWANPTGGYGHVADEQPLPYIYNNGISLTPRFGGEEAFQCSGYKSLPMPYGELCGSWPLRQRAYNIFRKRVNIYWRNLFCSLCGENKEFYFSKQLDYKLISNGFVGRCPLLTFHRTFSFSEMENNVCVSDEIRFRQAMNFRVFIPFRYAEPLSELCRLELCGNKEVYNIKEISSSTGAGSLLELSCNKLSYSKGDVINNSVIYHIL